MNSAADWYADAEQRERVEKKRMTNGGRIRQMTDEELADWITDGHEQCDLCAFGACKIESECLEGVMKWLKQEVSNDRDDHDPAGF